MQNHICEIDARLIGDLLKLRRQAVHVTGTLKPQPDRLELIDSRTIKALCHGQRIDGPHGSATDDTWPNLIPDFSKRE